MQSKDKGRTPIREQELAAGYEFQPTSFELSESVISKYLKAVGGQQYLLTLGIAPPLAIAAYAMTAMSQSLLLPPGSIHASQEFEFFRLVPIGATINYCGRIAQKLERGRLHLLVIELSALNQDREKVLSGKATIVVPN